MKECWINVMFVNGKVKLGCPLHKVAALIEANNMLRMYKVKTIYRLHVRLK